MAVFSNLKQNLKTTETNPVISRKSFVILQIVARYT